MSLLRQAAHAKINLHLHVTGRRPDGYHLLDSLVVFAGAADIVTARASERLSLEIAGPFAASLLALEADDNLVIRAARALARANDIQAGALIRLEKNLPLASGIGGGSADAAAALRVLHQLWRLDQPIADSLAVSLGADVPVCLAGRPALMRGIGDELLPAPILPELGLVLVNPLIPVVTNAVFRARGGAAFNPQADLPRRWPTASDAARDLRRLGNDLQAPAITIAPVIGEVLAALGRQRGCLLARMSGSGATCFGLFEPGPDAERACRAMSDDWWTWHGGLTA